MLKQEYKMVRIGGKRWKLPQVLPFEGNRGYHFYNVREYRKPRPGEFYISGAIPEAYRAQHNLSWPYLIAERGAKARQVSRWEAVKE